MNDYETLAMAFATTVATGAGKKLIDWLKGHFDSNAAEAADTLVADPDNDSAKRILTDILQAELVKCPSLLDQVGVDYAPQTSTVSDGSTNIQIQGNNNRLEI